ncbi:MAG: hypothetical protein JXP34_24470 [Planctomycetes bacterium]|nr:hypothetical protein [Planctomycetota bacterium]
MPGLVGFYRHRSTDVGANARLLDRLLERTRADGDRVIDRHVDEHAGLALLAAEPLASRHAPLRSADGRWIIFLDGAISPPRPPREAPGDLAEELAARGGKAAGELGGQFALFLYDSREKILRVATDRFASRFLHVAEFGEGIAYASELRAFTVLPDARRSLDPIAACDLLNFHFVVGERTLLDGVRLLPHASFHTIRPEGVERERYWDYPASAASGPAADPDSLAEAMNERLVAAVRDSCAGRQEPVAILLSGGMDSRMIAAIASRIGIDYRLVHHGNPRDRESRLTAEVARALGQPLSVFDPRDRIPTEDIGDGLAITDARFAPAQSTLLGTVRFACRDLGVRDFLHGLALDVLFQVKTVVVYRRANPKPAYDDGDRADMLSSGFQVTPTYLYEGLLREPYRSLVAPRPRLIEAARECGGDDLQALYQRFYFANRGRRYVGGVARTACRDAEFVFPGLDHDLFDAALAMPESLRWQARLYRMIFCRYYPEVAAVPYNWTGRPLSEWADGVRWRGLGSRLQYYLSRLSFGRWNGYLSTQNLDRCLRTRPDFRRWVSSTILSSRALDRGIYDREGIRRLLRLEASGRNYSSLIFGLLGLEYFHRLVLDGTSVGAREEVPVQ